MTLVDGLVGARAAELLDVQPRMPGLDGGDRGEDGIDAIGGLVVSPAIWKSTSAA